MCEQIDMTGYDPPGDLLETHVHDLIELEGLADYGWDWTGPSSLPHTSGSTFISIVEFDSTGTEGNRGRIYRRGYLIAIHK